MDRLPYDLLCMIASYTIEPIYKLPPYLEEKLHENHIAEFIYYFNLCWNPHPAAIQLLEEILPRRPEVIEWGRLSANPNAISILERHPDKIDWIQLSSNPNAIHLLEANIDKINWAWLSENPNAIPILEKHMDKIYWTRFSGNPNAIPILEANPDMINWAWLSSNHNGIPLLEKNMDMIDWMSLSANPNAIPLLEANPDKIDWWMLSANPNGIPLLKANMDRINWMKLSENPNVFDIISLEHTDPNDPLNPYVLYHPSMIRHAHIHSHPRILTLIELGIIDIDDLRLTVFDNPHIFLIDHSATKRAQCEFADMLIKN